MTGFEPAISDLEGQCSSTRTSFAFLILRSSKGVYELVTVFTRGPRGIRTPNVFRPQIYSLLSDQLLNEPI